MVKETDGKAVDRDYCKTTLWLLFKSFAKTELCFGFLTLRFDGEQVCFLGFKITSNYLRS